MADQCTTFTNCKVVQDILNDLNDTNGDHADDATWVLTSSFVILTMQSGFGMLEMGSSARGHEVNIMLKNVYDVVCGAFAYYALGFGISYGSPSNGFMGMGDFFVDTDGRNPTEAGLLFTTYIFQFSFAATATTIVSGCLAMRCRFLVYCIYSFFSVVVYAFVAHWIWAKDGWLAELGAHDFAGSGPVHLFGAINGLIGILWIGPRIGRFDGSRPAEDFLPSSNASILFGLFMLWWGWIGFNCGSSFGITNRKWLVATRAAVTTISATAGGGLAALPYTRIRSRGKVLPEDVANGILGSLVAVTAPCACIHPYEAVIIGFIGSLCANLANHLLLRFNVDDPVGAIGVHGAAGIWGVLAVGLFADSELPGVEVRAGVFRGGGFELLGKQMLLVLSIIGWSVLTMNPFFYLIGIICSGDWRNARVGLRVDPGDEVTGLDYVVHGCVPKKSNLPTFQREQSYPSESIRNIRDLQQGDSSLTL